MREPNIDNPLIGPILLGIAIVAIAILAGILVT